MNNRWTVTPTTTTSIADKKSEAVVTIAPVEVLRPQRCRVRRGNGDADGLGRTAAEVRAVEVSVVQRIAERPRRVDGFTR